MRDHTAWQQNLGSLNLLRFGLLRDVTEYYIVQISNSWNDSNKELCAYHPHNTMGCVHEGQKHSIQSLHVYMYKNKKH